MNWSTAAHLKAQLYRAWERGDLLRVALGAGDSCFPLRLTLKAPASADLTHQFQAVRMWAAQLSDTRYLHLEWQEVRHRVQGSQRLPVSAWVRTRDDALDWLGMRHEYRRFAELVAVTRDANPALLAWLERYPLRALDLADAWPRLLSVVGWRVARPRPDLYLRQVDLPGVHTKFIESHRAVLSELLTLVLPESQIDGRQNGIAQFALRFGFLGKPARIRLRVLDPGIHAAPGTCCPDMTLDADSFAALRLPVTRVFITENEINFLAFPRVAGALVVFGAGYGWDALARARWLGDCRIHYWGDIDTHGFAILDGLRTVFPQVESLLMDRSTLDAHAEFWGVDDTPVIARFANLHPDEQVLYNDLCYNHIGNKIRLEQEHVRFHWLTVQLARALVE